MNPGYQLSKMADDDGWEESVVLMELNGIIDSEWIRNCGNTWKIIGVETETPLLQMDHYVFTGKYEDTVGTDVLFQVDKTNPELEKRMMDQRHSMAEEPTRLSYAAHTFKRLHMQRSFLSEREKPPTESTSGAATQSTSKLPTGTATQSTSQLPAATQSISQLSTGAATQSTSKLPTGTATQSTSQLPAATQSTSQLPAATQSISQLPTGTATQSTSQPPAATQSISQLPTGAVTQSISKPPTETVTQSTSKLPTETATQSTPKLPTETANQSTSIIETDTDNQSTLKIDTETASESSSGLVTEPATQSTSKLDTETTAKPHTQHEAMEQGDDTSSAGVTSGGHDDVTETDELQPQPDTTTEPSQIT